MSLGHYLLQLFGVLDIEFSFSEDKILYISRLFISSSLTYTNHNQERDDVGNGIIDLYI